MPLAERRFTGTPPSRASSGRRLPLEQAVLGPELPGSPGSTSSARRSEVPVRRVRIDPSSTPCFAGRPSADDAPAEGAQHGARRRASAGHRRQRAGPSAGSGRGHVRSALDGAMADVLAVLLAVELDQLRGLVGPLAARGARPRLAPSRTARGRCWSLSWPWSLHRRCRQAEDMAAPRRPPGRPRSRRPCAATADNRSRPSTTPSAVRGGPTAPGDLVERAVGRVHQHLEQVALEPHHDRLRLARPCGC